MTDIQTGRQPAYLDSNEALAETCRELSGKSALGFDSEFIRTNTYYPKPGLFQLEDGEESFLVDPLAIDEWEGFKRLLINESTTVIMHSCSEDLGLLGSFLGVLPRTLFDTQRAAAFTGQGYSLSYQALVKNELDIDIPKGETRSDWLRRPLSETQLEYAALDVEYLVELQQLLEDKLRKRDMLEWFEQDCRDLLANVPDETNTAAWENAYQSIASAWQLDEPALRLLQKLAYWREQEARLRDKPKSWIIRDPELLTLASQLPGTGTIDEADIRRTDVFPARFVDREARQLTRFLNGDFAAREPAKPGLVSKPLGGSARKQLKTLQKLTRDKAEELDISPELLARKRLWVELLENQARGDIEFWPPGLNNWRRELLEPGVMAILSPGSSR
ncbi:MAG: ribonuclease D [Gammaproteobacteria bacterium]